MAGKTQSQRSNKRPRTNNSDGEDSESATPDLTQESSPKKVETLGAQAANAKQAAFEK